MHNTENTDPFWLERFGVLEPIASEKEKNLSFFTYLASFSFVFVLIDSEILLLIVGLLQR